MSGSSFDSNGELAAAAKPQRTTSRTEHGSNGSAEGVEQTQKEDVIDLLTGKVEGLFDDTVRVLPSAKLVGSIKEKIPLLGFMDKMAIKIGEKIVQAKNAYDSNKMNDPDNNSPGGSDSSEK